MSTAPAGSGETRAGNAGPAGVSTVPSGDAPARKEAPARGGFDAVRDGAPERPGAGLRIAAYARGWSVGAGVDLVRSATSGTTYLSPVEPVVLARAFDRPAERWSAGHRGVDLSASAGQEVRAPGPGVVTFAGWVVDRGVITIQHPSGLRSSLEPVTNQVAAGTRVAAGDVVARVAADLTHCGAIQCVHWGVRDGDDYLDPMLLIGDPPRVVLLPDRASGSDAAG